MPDQITTAPHHRVTAYRTRADGGSDGVDFVAYAPPDQAAALAQAQVDAGAALVAIDGDVFYRMGGK